MEVIYQGETNLFPSDTRSKSEATQNKNIRKKVQNISQPNENTFLKLIYNVLKIFIFTVQRIILEQYTFTELAVKYFSLTSVLSEQNNIICSIDHSQVRNGKLCRVAVTDLGEFTTAITIRG